MHEPKLLKLAHLKIHPKGPSHYNQGTPEPGWDEYSTCPTYKKVHPVTGQTFRNDNTGSCGYGYNAYPTVVELSYAKIPKPSRTMFVGESTQWYAGGSGTTFGAGHTNFMNHDDTTASFYFVDGHSEKRLARKVPLATSSAYCNVTGVGYGKFLNTYFWGLRDCYYHDNATVGDLD